VRARVTAGLTVLALAGVVRPAAATNVCDVTLRCHDPICVDAGDYRQCVGPIDPNPYDYCVGLDHSPDRACVPEPGMVDQWVKTVIGPLPLVS
jgi:hypothetical protein